MEKTGMVRTGGIALAVGAVTWAVTLVATDPPVDGVSPRLEILGGLAYQLGVGGFLLATWRTAAVGDGRTGRLVLRAETVLLALAAVWSVVYAIEPRTQEHVLMVVLDVAWPLSMLGLVAVGVAVLRAGVWSPPLDRLPLIASLWLPLDVAVTLLAGDTAALAFRAAWLTVVWGGLGVLIARGDAIRRASRSGAASPSDEDRVGDQPTTRPRRTVSEGRDRTSRSSRGSAS